MSQRYDGFRNNRGMRPYLYPICIALLITLRSQLTASVRVCVCFDSVLVSLLFTCPYTEHLQTPLNTAVTTPSLFMSQLYFNYAVKCHNVNPIFHSESTRRCIVKWWRRDQNVKKTRDDWEMRLLNDGRHGHTLWAQMERRRKQHSNITKATLL